MDPDDMQQLKKDVGEIKRALLGDEAYRELGLLQRVSLLEKWKENLTLKIASVTGAAIVVAWLIGKFIEKV